MSTTNIEQAKRIVGERMDLFARNVDQYRHADYKEAQLRREFLDPFFEALGWDVTNRQGWAEQYKEVVNEDALKTGGTTQAPDYSFRIGGARKFFAEAKKPSRAIKTDASAAYQLRRYAWSAKLPLSVLSDFEELAVYDCRARPAASDKASVGRVNFYTFDQYLDRLPEIYNVFSKEAVLRGSFDRFIQESRGKRGTTPVDAEFLKEIEAWRTALAKNIAALNPQLTLDELNDAVQRTIDRIVFLRMAEDRGTEEYGQLQRLMAHPRVYAGLLRLCQQADDRYNSGLFDFTADTLTPRLKIDDDKLGAILGDLYYPKSPYEFSVLGADTLGDVYEQFLGKVIRLTASHQAKVEDKPEVKKAGGVHYTPSYIGEYLAQQTVGKMIAGKSPQELARFRVADIACGSGTLLLCAFELLLAHYLDWYTAHREEKGVQNRIYESAQGWRLTTAEKKRILTTHLFGVDIDRQAVEVTKLSLLLRVLEGESQETLGKQLSLFKERVLPNLDANIKCGNSLIGMDYFENQLMPDADELRRVNPFDWAREFPEVMRDGGFDCIIGNPPYVRQEDISKFKTFFLNHYKNYHGLADIYVYFYERALALLKESGYLGYITSSKFQYASYGVGLRELLARHLQLMVLVDYGDVQLFKGAVTYPAILIGKKSANPGSYSFAYGRANKQSGVIPEQVLSRGQTVVSDKLTSQPWVLVSGTADSIIAEMGAESSPLAAAVGRAQIGIKTSLNQAFVVQANAARSIIRMDKRAHEILKPYGRGRDLQKWMATSNGDFLICTRESITIGDYPSVQEHLAQFEKQLRSRYEVRRGDYEWWVIRQVANTEIYENPKIVYPDLCSKPRFALNLDGMFPNNTVFCIPSDNRALLGFLNSRMAWFWITHNCPSNRGGAYRLSNQFIDRMPIMQAVLSNSQLTALVTQMLDLKKQLTAAQTAPDRELVQRQIDATDRQIDALVYELYELSEEEIRVVEEGAL